MLFKFDIQPSTHRVVLDTVREYQPCSSAVVGYVLRRALPFNEVRHTLHTLTTLKALARTPQGYTLNQGA